MATRKTGKAKAKPRGAPVRLNRRMLPTDAGFWYAEDISPGLRSTIGGVFILEGPPDLIKSRIALERAIRESPRLRQKVVNAPYHLLPPEWVEDDRLDLQYHIRREVLPPPGDEAALMTRVAALIATPLDKARPLWEAHLIEGLQGGKAALFMKVHHSMVDGVGAVAALDTWTDPTPALRRSGGERFEMEPRRTGSPAGEVLSDAVEGVKTLARESVSLAGGAVMNPRETLRKVAAVGRGLTGLASDARAERIVDPLSTASTGISRRLQWMAVPIADLRRARTALDATINDLVLTAVSGTVGRYHASRGVRAKELRAMVPMSLRGDDEMGTFGNRIGMLSITLPVGEPDAARRLEIIRGRTGVAKRDRRAALYPFLMRAMLLLPGAVFRSFVEQLTSKVNLICTNIPGTAERRYYAGRAIERWIPFGPVTQACPLSIALLSYLDKLEIGIASDPDAIPDPDKVRALLTEGFDEIFRMAGRANAPRPRKRRRKAPVKGREGAAPEGPDASGASGEEPPPARSE